MGFVFFQRLLHLHDLCYAAPVDVDVLPRLSENFRIRSMSTTSKAGPTLASKPLRTPELHVAFFTYSVHDGVIAFLPIVRFASAYSCSIGLQSQWSLGRNLQKCPASRAILSTTDSSPAKSGCVDSSFSMSFCFIPSSEKKLILQMYTVAFSLTSVASALLNAGFESDILSPKICYGKKVPSHSVSLIIGVCRPPGLTFMRCV